MLTNNTAIETKYLRFYEIALEKKYGLNISTNNEVYQNDELLRMLDEMYSSFPKGLIKEITSYYRAKGINTNVKFIFKETHVSGSFSFCNNEITLFYYPNTNDKFGEWVIGHEMGHYIHKYLNDRYGYNRLKHEWTKLNDDMSYGKSEWTDRHQEYFVREYSLTNYAEDFATIVELIAKNSIAGFKKRVFKTNGPLKKKADLLLKILTEKSYSFQKLKKSRDEEYQRLRMAME